MSSFSWKSLLPIFWWQRLHAVHEHIVNESIKECKWVVLSVTTRNETRNKSQEFLFQIWFSFSFQAQWKFNSSENIILSFHYRERMPRKIVRRAVKKLEGNRKRLSFKANSSLGNKENWYPKKDKSQLITEGLLLSSKFHFNSLTFTLFLIVMELKLEVNSMIFMVLTTIKYSPLEVTGWCDWRF